METKLINKAVFKNGKFKFEFNQLEVFRILLDEFGYGYVKLHGVGKFLKSVPGGYEIIPFFLIKNSFTKYLRDTIKSEMLPQGLTHETLLNMNFNTKSSPVKQNYARAFLQSKNKLKESDFIVEQSFLKFK